MVQAADQAAAALGSLPLLLTLVAQQLLGKAMLVALIFLAVLLVQALVAAAAAQLAEIHLEVRVEMEVLALHPLSLVLLHIMLAAAAGVPAALAD
jgi:hypothetical protein